MPTMARKKQKQYTPEYRVEAGQAIHLGAASVKDSATSQILLGLADELEATATTIAAFVEKTKSSEVQKTLRSLEEAAAQVGKAWSGSWIGYHANIYYKNFEDPPVGARFRSDEGPRHSPWDDGTIGDWEEFKPDHVREQILSRAGNVDLAPYREAALAARKLTNDSRADLLSIFDATQVRHSDSFLQRPRDEL